MNRAHTNPSAVFFFDVDNTLLDNDRVAEDLKRHLTNKVGEASAQRYWEIFEQLRTELGYADYLGALQRYRVEQPRDPKLLEVSYFMVNYPFANRLFPESLDAVEHARRLGRAVILSDGDVVFQPRKVDRSGLYEMFEGHVLIYIHKELELEDVEAKYPATHYVMVDDKVRILAAIKKYCVGCGAGGAVSQSGHHAGADWGAAEVFPAADFGCSRKVRAYSASSSSCDAPARTRLSNSRLRPARLASDNSKKRKGCRHPWVAHMGNNICARHRTLKPRWNTTVTRMPSSSGCSSEISPPLTES